MLSRIVKEFWFIIGIILIFLATIGDSTETISGAGICLRMCHGPEIVIILIFFFSGLMLDAGRIKSGLMDIKGILIAIGIIFFVAPAVAAFLGKLPLNPGIITGIFLVAVMPTTLSSGVVMTKAAGGNMAHAILITIIASGIAVFTIPLTLTFLLQIVQETTVVSILKQAMMIKIALFVLGPLGLGILTSIYAKPFIEKFNFNFLNQLLILIMVWTGISQTRQTIISSRDSLGVIFLLVFGFHTAILLSAGILTWFFKLGRGRRESVILMGGQKTLPLSLILQVSFFPQYGLALVVCVVHHLVHLSIDGYLVKKLKDFR